MEEQRKHAILFAATLLCARKLIGSTESAKPNLAEQYLVDISAAPCVSFANGELPSLRHASPSVFFRVVVRQTDYPALGGCAPAVTFLGSAQDERRNALGLARLLINGHERHVCGSGLLAFAGENVLGINLHSNFE